jgi:hypothetical protein
LAVPRALDNVHLVITVHLTVFPTIQRDITAALLISFVQKDLECHSKFPVVFILLVVVVIV